MNEFETIEQDLSRMVKAKPPSYLRSSVLKAIQSQRETYVNETVHSPSNSLWARLRRLRPTATIAATGLLTVSLLIFTIVDRSTSRLYQGRSEFATAHQSSVTRSNAQTIASQQKLAASPQAFFRRHFALLQQFNSELFDDASKESPQTSGDRKPLGSFRRRLSIRDLELASIESSQSKIGSVA